MISQGRSGAESFLTVGAYCFGFFTVHISNVKVEPVFVGECFRAFCTLVLLFFCRHLFGLKIYMFTNHHQNLGKSCSFGLQRVPFVNCRQFMYLVISLLVLGEGCGI